jgi:hypothetical protein
VPEKESRTTPPGLADFCNPGGAAINIICFANAEPRSADPASGTAGAKTI